MRPDRKEVKPVHAHEIQLRLVNEDRRRQIREAADHRRAGHAGGAPRHHLRHQLGRALIRLGRALAAEAERESVVSPARPR
jgi:hypothetical protein